MAESRNCIKCKKVFTYTGVPVCQDCQKETEKLFDEARTYIKEHPDCKLAEVAEITGASHKQIFRWIREGRIEISSAQAADGGLTCGNCGKPIVTGRYCSSCAIKMNDSVKEAFGKNKPEEKKPSSGKLKEHGITKGKA
ncbi:hypothetical protein AGMMS49975_07540 [Clostridia bacterium]|nr:hypothetical protein AGMMS49975_07540 [Clostridia bacterium]GHU73779.1 hypothetical protein FACS1894188_00180 [Clostridia bacterium]